MRALQSEGGNTFKNDNKIYTNIYIVPTLCHTLLKLYMYTNIYSLYISYIYI